MSDEERIVPCRECGTPLLVSDGERLEVPAWADELAAKWEEYAQNLSKAAKQNESHGLEEVDSWHRGQGSAFAWCAAELRERAKGETP